MERGQKKKKFVFESSHFEKGKNKARSPTGTLGIPFDVSGPRPVHEASVFTAENVSAGLVFQDRDERRLHLMLQAHEVLRSRELQASAGIAPGPGETGNVKRIPSLLKSGKVLCRTDHGLCVRDFSPLHSGQSRYLRPSTGQVPSSGLDPDSCVAAAETDLGNKVLTVGMDPDSCVAAAESDLGNKVLTAGMDLVTCAAAAETDLGYQVPASGLVPDTCVAAAVSDLGNEVSTSRWIWTLNRLQRRLTLANRFLLLLWLPKLFPQGRYMSLNSQLRRALNSQLRRALIH